MSTSPIVIVTADTRVSICVRPTESGGPVVVVRRMLNGRWFQYRVRPETWR